MKKNDLLVIFGPTASGKSKLAVQIASKHKSAIINLDSLQVYKDLRILTDRPDDELCKNYDHRLYGILKGNENCTVATWLEKAVNEINECFSSNIIPIIVGGTGMYLKALMEGLSEIPSISENTNKKMKSHLEIHGLHYLYEKILSNFPNSKISSNDKQRIIRSYSLLLETGKVLEEWQTKKKPLIKNINFKIILTNMNREELYRAAELRVENMFKNDAVNEVKLLHKKRYDADLSIMKAIGVREISNFIDGKTSLEDAKGLMKKNTRNYIKRQITWIKGNNITKNVNIEKYL